MYNREVMNIQKLGITNTNLSTRILKNKTLLKSLEKISDHGTSFSATTSLLLSLGLRPLAIFSTPDTEKENKQYAASNSISSGLVKYALVEAVALPVEYAIKNIDKNPNKYLNQSTIKNLSGNSKELINSKSYKLLTQVIKLSTGFLTAIPKSILTIALIPVIMDKVLFRDKKQPLQTTQNPALVTTGQKPPFTGRITDKISKGLSKIIDNNHIQNLAKKYEHKDKDIPKHITAGTDILLTGAAAYQTNKSEKIKENRKKALIYNNIISTAITLFGGYAIDNVIKNKSSKFIEKFKQINAADPKLYKYIEGINILRPALIFAGIYYGLLPIISTYTAEKVDKFIERHQKSN